MTHTRRTSLATAAILAPLALGLTACGDDDADETTPSATVTVTATPSSSQPAATETPATETAAPAATPAVEGTVDAVAQTALGAIDGTIFTVDRNDGGSWEVSILSADGTDNDVDVAADGTTITRGPVVDGDDDGDDQAERTRLLGVPVDYAAAIAAALADVPGGSVTGVDLDEDDGVATWEVQLDEDTADETTVDVDATSGAVLRTERD